MWPQREKIDLSLMPNVINLDYHFNKVFFFKKKNNNNNNKYNLLISTPTEQIDN